MASIAYRTMFIFFNKSDNGIYNLAFAYEVVFTNSRFLAKQAPYGPHYVLSYIYALAHVGSPVCKALFCWQISTCLSRYWGILYLLCLHVWIGCLD